MEVCVGAHVLLLCLFASAGVPTRRGHRKKTKGESSTKPDQLKCRKCRWFACYPANRFSNDFGINMMCHATRGVLPRTDFIFFFSEIS